MAKEEFTGAPPAEETTVEAPASTEVSTKVDKGNVVSDLSELAWSQLNCWSPQSKYRPDGVSDGDIVFEQEVIIAPQGAKMNLVVLYANKQYKDDNYGTGEPSQIYDSLAEAKAADNGFPIIPCAEIAGLLEWDPKGLIDEDDAKAIYPFEVGERRYAMVKYIVQKNKAVEENYAKLRTIAFATGDLWKTFVSLSTKHKQYQANSWHQFIVSPTGKPIPEETESFIKHLAGLE